MKGTYTESAGNKESYCPVPEGKLFFVKRGNGPPIVFLHGFCLDHRMWESQMDYFSARFTCVAIDLRGFGKSSLPTDNLYAHYEDLVALLDFLGLDQPVILIGLSMGARVIANFALTHPQKTRAVIFIDGAIDGYAFKDFDLGYIYTAGKELGIAAANRLWLDHPIFGPARENPVVFEQLTEEVMSYSGWHWLNKNPVKNLTPPAMEQLQKIDVPTLIMIGQLDIPDFKDLALKLKKQIDHAQYIEIAGAGHMSNMEKPDLVNDLLHQFLDQLPN
jgi:pimeloyl-ACP methyl ester carboxylesterase